MFNYNFSALLTGKTTLVQVCYQEVYDDAKIL